MKGSHMNDVIITQPLDTVTQPLDTVGYRYTTVGYQIFTDKEAKIIEIRNQST